MHAEPAPAAAMGPTAAEWTVGIVFVLAALAIVGFVALAIAALPG